MVKKTLYFGHPAYLSLRNRQMVLRLPQVEKNDTVSTSFLCSPANAAVVCVSAKIQIWKQFTTVHHAHVEWWELFVYPQRYKFESNSQPTAYIDYLPEGCLCIRKDTNLKAIHNGGRHAIGHQAVVCVSAKIQIWKQFTTEAITGYIEHYVVCVSAKIQIWKQFTTNANVASAMTVLFVYPQRYKFESNSQRGRRFYCRSQRCLCIRKDTNLKAIHNHTV